ncbi:hypothetical protein OAU50_04230 [Planctomycetota bacterium]|nr:hypothetical protein [Planctomycetota bacterium]
MFWISAVNNSVPLEYELGTHHYPVWKKEEMGSIPWFITELHVMTVNSEVLEQMVWIPRLEKITFDRPITDETRSWLQDEFPNIKVEVEPSGNADRWLNVVEYYEDSDNQEAADEVYSTVVLGLTRKNGSWIGLGDTLCGRLKMEKAGHAYQQAVKYGADEAAIKNAATNLGLSGGQRMALKWLSETEALYPEPRMAVGKELYLEFLKAQPDAFQKLSGELTQLLIEHGLVANPGFDAIQVPESYPVDVALRQYTDVEDTFEEIVQLTFAYEYWPELLKYTSMWIEFSRELELRDKAGPSGAAGSFWAHRYRAEYFVQVGKARAAYNDLEMMRRLSDKTGECKWHVRSVASRVAALTGD